MKKFILAWAVLLGFAGPCLAAFAIFQTYTPSAPARTQVNITSAPYNATCDAQYASRVVTITNSGSGLRDVAVTVNTFQPSDDNKKISIPGAGAGGFPYTGTITYVDATHVTLSSDASVALSSSTQLISWGTDAGPAFAAFRTAYQGATPVQLNMPGNCGYDPATGGQFVFKGISDLIVAGNGPATSGFVTLGGGNPLFGGSGQFADNSHSLRTDDANAGDSCVTIKTQPAVTVSAVANNLPSSATFTGVISGTTLTASSVTGTINVGAVLRSTANAGVDDFTTIVSQSTGPAGGAGTYVVSVSKAVSSQTMYTAPAAFTADVATTGVMTVSAVQDGALAVGMIVFANGGGLQTNFITIASQLTGSAGGTGTYRLSVPPVSTVSSRAFYGTGQPRVTLNSTAGLTTGDTLYLTGIVGTGAALGQAVNGLRWIKVINGTQIDIFQSEFKGLYSSGGTGGGDRTSLMTTGSKVMMTGYSLQAYWAAPYSQPSNFQWFEYRTVASTNSTTHQVCFDTPLTNTYKAEWPQYNTGNLSEPDPGGPATVYVLDPTWELTHTYKDFTLVVPAFQSTANGRSITWDNVVMSGANCAIPTQNVTHNWINVDASTCNIETDKLVGDWNITGGAVKKVHVQSSSMDNITLNNVAVGVWHGSPKKLTLNNSSISGAGILATDPSLKIGTDSYGVSGESIFDTVSIANGVVQGGNGTTTGADTANWTMTGGVITIPNALSTGVNALYETQTRYIVPGYYMSWFGSGNGGAVRAQNGRAFKVVSVSQDVDNIYVTTSEAGGFPTGSWIANGLKVVAHPAPKLTVTSASGGADTLTVYNGCTAQAPMYSCANYTRTGGAAGTTAVDGPIMWGELTSFSFTNSVPYTNTGSLTWSTPQFASTFGYLSTSNVQTNINFTINNKLPSSGGGGTRVWTSSGVTGNQASDSFPSAPPAGAVFGNKIGLSAFSANTPSDSPQVTVTLRTNQQLPP